MKECRLDGQRPGESMSDDLTRMPKGHVPVAGMPLLGVGGASDRTARHDDLGIARLRDAEHS